VNTYKSVGSRKGKTMAWTYLLMASGFEILFALGLK
jgi:hypothetical protein